MLSHRLIVDDLYPHRPPNRLAESIRSEVCEKMMYDTENGFTPALSCMFSALAEKPVPPWTKFPLLLPSTVSRSKLDKMVLPSERGHSATRIFGFFWSRCTCYREMLQSLHHIILWSTVSNWWTQANLQQTPPSAAALPSSQLAWWVPSGGMTSVGPCHHITR